MRHISCTPAVLYTHICIHWYPSLLVICLVHLSACIMLLHPAAETQSSHMNHFQPVTVRAGVILISLRHMCAVDLKILLHVIIDGAFFSLPVKQSLLVPVAIVLIFLFLCQTFQRGELFLSSALHSELLQFKLLSEESGPTFSLWLLAYFVVAHSACQNVHFISRWMSACTKESHFSSQFVFYGAGLWSLVEVAW